MRVLIVTNLTPDGSAPQRGRWVTDQAAALRDLGVDVELMRFPVGKSNYMPAVRVLRRRLKAESFDLIHAHYGLAGWVAKLAGADPLIVTFHGTDVRHPYVGRLSRSLSGHIELVAGVSKALFMEEDGRPGLPIDRAPIAVLPCGPDLGRFGPLDRVECRHRLGLDPDGRYLFFPANPARGEKRYDRAAELARRCEAELLTGGSIEPEAMSSWINAASAVLVTSDYEGFGMAGLEAIACRVPVLSTPVGIAPFAIGDVDGCLVSGFDLERWTSCALGHLSSADPRVEGRASAEIFSAAGMADRVLNCYETVLHPRPSASFD